MAEQAQPEESDELTREELQDLVIVERVQSVPEAGFLVALLEDEGIPAIIHGASLSGMTLAEFFAPEVRVPRALLEQAKEVIAADRAKARERGVEDAFTEQKIQEELSDKREDTDMAEMNRLNTESAVPRNEQLAAFIAKWLVEGTNPVRMCQYLAVAGLSREEAEALIRNVKEKRQDLMDQAFNNQVMAGLGLALVGGALIFIGPFGYGIGLLIAGVGIAAHAYSAKS
jgi:hypothetical protein